MQKLLLLGYLLMIGSAYADCASDYDKTMYLLDGVKNNKLAMDEATFKAAFATSLKGLATNNCRAEITRLQQHILSEQQRHPQK